MSFFSRLFGRKESQARIVTSINQIGKPVSTPANYEGFAKQGYSKNVVVYTAIEKITKAASGITWSLYNKNRRELSEITEHPLLQLWSKPNPLMGTSTFIENVVGYYKLTGNSYIEANQPVLTRPPLELWPVRPDKMKIIPGPRGYVGAYEFSYGGVTRKWIVDQVSLKSAIFHWKSFNPLSDWYGMSPLEAAMLTLDQYNAGQRWNLSLLQNSATPSGVLQYKVSDANPRGELTDEQYKRIRQEFESAHAGSKNAGRPMILEGGLSWQQISISPKDMDFINSKEVTAIDLCLALGVPPEMMGLGEKTYSNQQEARLAFYEETILPLMDSFRDDINRWLTPVFGENLYLDYDRDDIEAIAQKREQKYTSLQNVSFLSQNEKRIAAGYEEQPGLDLWLVGNEMLSKLDLERMANPDEEAIDNNAALNGAQVTSLVEVVSAVANGQLPRESAVQIIMAAFNLTAEQADAILGEVGQGFVPAPVQENNPTPPTPNENEETEDDQPENEIEDEIEEDEKGWKSFNLVNRNERRKAWRRQNQRRKELTSSFKRQLVEDFKSLTKRLTKTAEDLKGRDAKLIEFALYKDLDEWTPELEKTLRRNTKFALEDFGLQVLREGKSLGFDMESKANLKFDSYVEAYIKRRTGEQIKTINSTNQKTIKRIVGEWVQTAVQDGDSGPELSKYLQMEFEELTPGRAERIARTEVSLASNNGSLEAVKSLDIPNMFKEWVTANDDRVRSGEHGGADHGVMNGAEVALDEKFGVPPDVLMEGPGDESAPADQVINCRCVLVYRSKN